MKNESEHLLEHVSSLRPLRCWLGTRHVLVVIPQLGLLKVVSGTLRGNGEAVEEATSLGDVAERIDGVRARRRLPVGQRPFQVVLFDARTAEGMAAAVSLRASDRGLKLLALVHDDDVQRAKLHALGVVTLPLPLRSSKLLVALAAISIPRSISAAKASQDGFGMPQPALPPLPAESADDLCDTVPSWIPEDAALRWLAETG